MIVRIFRNFSSITVLMGLHRLFILLSLHVVLIFQLEDTEIYIVEVFASMLSLVRKPSMYNIVPATYKQRILDIYQLMLM